jgi:hypothetical protein
MSEKYSSRLKAEIALEAISGKRSLDELSTHFEVPIDNIELWKSELIENAENIFRSPLDVFNEQRNNFTDEQKVDFEFLVLLETYILYCLQDHFRNNIRFAVVDSFMQVALESADLNGYEDDQGNPDPYESYPDEIYGLLKNVGDKEALKNALMDALAHGLAGKNYDTGIGWT